MRKNMLSSHFKFNKQERSGIFFLLFLIVVFQVTYFVAGSSYLSADETNSLKIDKEYQLKINQLKSAIVEKDTVLVYPFNPNFITDYKGYSLGMSPQEIDRLHAFRDKHQFVNSGKEFQKVTLVSDSLLEILSPYFKFPEWTSRSRGNRVSSSKAAIKEDTILESNHKTIIKNLNSVSAEELRTVRGVGEVLSGRIVKFRDLLGGFIVEQQLDHVYGLKPEVVVRILSRFKILEKPIVTKINVNKATANELAKLVYLKHTVAVQIVAYREEKGRIGSLDELISIQGFPSDKLDIIKLYLQL